MEQAADVFKLNEDQTLLTSLKAAGLAGQKDKVNELSVKFDEHSEQLQEVWYSLLLEVWFSYANHKPDGNLSRAINGTSFL